MWEERQPKEGETVKLVFADWTGLETRIGVVERFAGDRWVIDVGERKVWWDRYGTLLVWNPKYVMQMTH